MLLEVPWPLAIWRIILRHIRRSLHGTNPYPGLNGIKLLFQLLKYPRRYALNRVDADTTVLECMREYLQEQKDRVGPPTPESVSRDVEKYLGIAVPPTAEFVHKYLEKYREKVFIVRNRVERERLMEFSLLPLGIDYRFLPGRLCFIGQGLGLAVQADFVLEDAAQDGDGAGVG